MQQQEDNPISLLGSIIWLLAALFFLYEFFLRTFVGSLAHQIIPDLHLNAETFALMGSGYYLAYGIMQVPVGILSDKYGVKKMMVLATLVCSIATLVFAHSSSFLPAFASRFLMGMGSAFAFVSLLVVTICWFPRKYFGFFAGMSQFVGTIGPILAGGPLVALVARSDNHWRAIFTPIAFIGFILAILIFFIVKEKPVTTGLPSSKAIPAISINKKLIALAKNKQAWLIALFSGTVYCSIAFLGAIWGTAYLETRHVTQSMAATIISLSWLSYAFGCPILGFISDYTQRRKPTMIFAAFLGLITTCCIIYLPTQPTYIYITLFIALGFAASGQNISIAIISEHVNDDVKATALGLNNGMISLFDTLTAPIAGIFIGLSSHGNALHLKPENFYIGFTIMPLVFLVALLLAVFFIKETYCQPQHLGLSK